MTKTETAIARGDAPPPPAIIASIGPQPPVIEAIRDALHAEAPHSEPVHVEAKPAVASRVGVRLAQPKPPEPESVVPKPIETQRAAAPAVKPSAVKQASVDPRAAASHHQRGRELTAAGKYREAIVELDEALRLQPDLALAYNARGYAYQLLRDYSHAIADYDSAIRLNPHYTNAIQNRDAAKAASQRTLTARSARP